MITSDFLKEINSNLLELEADLFNEYSIDEKYLNFYILGLPRTGTTLLGQIMFNSMNVGCTNSLISKFWDAPLTGTYLSRIVINNTKFENYDSFYGQPMDVFNPHEFSWFWNRYLSQKDLQNYIPKLSSILIAMSNILGRGLVHKPLEYMFDVIDNFDLFSKKSIFIYIDRNELEVALSLAMSRLIKKGNLNEWWGSYPPKYRFDLIKNKNYKIQIAGQIKFLKEKYDDILLKIPEERLVLISYNELVNNPNGVIMKIFDKANKLDDSLRVINNPKSFNIKQKYYEKKLIDELTEGLSYIENEFVK